MATANKKSDRAFAILQQAVQQHQLGRLAEAEKSYRQVLALAPNQPDAYNLLGVIAHQTGRIDYAVDLMTRAVALNAKDANFHRNLADALYARGDYGKASAEFRSALSLVPTDAIAVNGLGLALRELGDIYEALQCFKSAFGLESTRWDFAFNLGTTLESLQEYEAAVTCYQRVRVLKPDSAETCNNLGNSLHALKRYREAESYLRRSLELKPDYAVAELNLGLVLLFLARTDEAVECFQRCITLDPGLSQAYNNLGYALREQGRTAEAMNWFRRAVEINPENREAGANILFSMVLLPDYDLEAISRASREFWLGHEPQALAQTAEPTHVDPGKRLRIGYISADFRRHPIAYFMMPLLAHRDKKGFEIYCYYNQANEDDFTVRIKTLSDHWRAVALVSDNTLASMIDADQIDILVDLSGHTAHNRLEVFARKPAPVQVTYLGYPATTGLLSMDYRLTDSIADPPGEVESYYSERLSRLPQSLWCYAPPPDIPEVSGLPASANGYVTFGSFNKIAKLGPEAISLWARVLHSVPGSRLLMASVPPGSAQARILELFDKFGIDASRLRLTGPLANVEFLRLYQEVDITLDSFPCNGATSTCESLWMGVPVISLLGNTCAGRAGLSLLTAAGYPEWVAQTDQQYIEIALKLAGDFETLSETRADLRRRVQNSALGNAAKFAMELESAYRGMWLNWCASNSGVNTRNSAV
jgi:protein O-GlcNAc transferase